MQRYNNMTLREWQKEYKPVRELIVNASSTDKNDSWREWPIGMGYNYARMFEEDQRSFVPNDDVARSFQIGNHNKTILCSFWPESDYARRNACTINRRTILGNLNTNGTYNSPLFPRDYLNELLNHKFVASPEGQGFDCHRHYEALIAGSIPVVERNALIEDKYKNMPILYTKDYSEITDKYLLKAYGDIIDKRYDFSKLFLSYYDHASQNDIKRSGNFWIHRLAKKNWYHA